MDLTEKGRSKIRHHSPLDFKLIAMVVADLFFSGFVVMTTFLS